MAIEIEKCQAKNGWGKVTHTWFIVTKHRSKKTVRMRLSVGEARQLVEELGHELSA